MPREKEGMRDLYVELKTRCGGNELISIGDAAEVLGVCKRTLQKTKSFPAQLVGRRQMVSVLALARWMS